MEIHKDFRMIGTQNPSQEIGRKPLPSSLLQKVVVIETPNYLVSEIVDIVRSRLEKVIPK